MSDTVNDMDAVFRKYALPLKKYVMTLCHDEDLADDMVADTFYKAITHVDSFHGGNMYTWLCTIAKNLFFNHVRKKETQNLSLDDEDNGIDVASEDRPLEDLLRKEQKMELFSKMQTLDPVEREVMYLRSFADLSFKEIGQVLGKTENWARVTFFRTKAKLRKVMERLD
ncbi:MAG: sigma-70 family RNA polymerase sigma factor [Clostridiales bacterium]|nr:sigma-70 family RNA polymerase sigma factor [Clostridiales bacterium]